MRIDYVLALVFFTQLSQYTVIVIVKLLSRVWLFATPWTVAYQAPQSMEFSRQENWSGLPFPSPGDLPNQGIEPGSPTLQADALPSEPPGKPLVHSRLSKYGGSTEKSWLISQIVHNPELMIIFPEVELPQVNHINIQVKFDRTNKYPK